MKKLFKVLTCLICALVLCVSTACKPEEKPEEPKEEMWFISTYQKN